MTSGSPEDSEQHRGADSLLIDRHRRDPPGKRTTRRFKRNALSMAPVSLRGIQWRPDRAGNAVGAVFLDSNAAPCSFQSGDVIHCREALA
jgi:hypothetical protein